MRRYKTSLFPMSDKVFDILYCAHCGQWRADRKKERKGEEKESLEKRRRWRGGEGGGEGAVKDVWSPPKKLAEGNGGKKKWAKPRMSDE